MRPMPTATYQRGCAAISAVSDIPKLSSSGEHDNAATRYRERRSGINDVLIVDEPVREALDELQLDNHDLAETVRVCLDAAETQRGQLDKALTESLPRPEVLPVPLLDILALTNYVENLRDRARELREANQPGAISKLRKELNELEARRLLADHLRSVLDEIERKKKLAAYQGCIDETRTNADHTQKQRRYETRGHRTTNQELCRRAERSQVPSR